MPTPKAIGPGAEDRELGRGAEARSPGAEDFGSNAEGFALDARRLREAGLLVLEGGFLVERGLRSGLAFERLLCVPEREAWLRGLMGDRVDIEVLSEAEISRSAGYPFHRGVIGLARRPPELGLEQLLASFPEGEPSLVLALPEISNPENLGSCIRSAAALGCSAVVLGRGGPDPLSRRVLRVSMGASLTLPWIKVDGPEALGRFEERGFATAACVLDPPAVQLREYPAPERLLVALGNEAFGLSEPWLLACRDRLTIPMSGGTDSLNLAAAAAIFLYETSRVFFLKSPLGD